MAQLSTATKSILASTTFWGSVVTVLGTLFPKVAAALGISSANAAQYGQYIVTAFGFLMTAYGRMTATQTVSLTGK